MTTEQLRMSLADRYRIERELGAGGMATVYLAQDLKHDRKVAVKVLKPELAAVIGAERFVVEIKTTAALQHPHILPLFDSGQADGFLYYVMPFIDGETLRTKLDREHQFGIEEAVRITSQVADALDYAHRHGVIHRDIKPENILLHDGRPMVADFGIALALSAAAGGRMTETGMSLGTPHYMSPEQATAEKEITGRSDIYSLGSVLYEMLTGNPPHVGATAQQIIMKIIAEEVEPVTAYRKSVPPNVAAAVARAVEKLPADRFATAAEFARALNDTGYNPSPTGPTGTVAHLRAGARSGAGRLLWGAVGMALLCAGLAAWGWYQVRRLTSAPTTWQYVTLGDTLEISPLAPSLALSPDGHTLVFKENAVDGLLWMKRDGALDPVPIPGTIRANDPVFSPDGEWVAYIADQKLTKVRLTSGSIVVVADSASGGYGGAAWLDDGTLVYASTDLRELRRVPAAGGPSVSVLTNADMTGTGLGHPTPLPGARGVIFEACTSGCVTMSLRVLDLRTGKAKQLVAEAGEGWYLPGGHLLYSRRDGVMMAAPFDLDRLELTGPAVPVLQRVQFFFGFPQFAWSPSGRVVYATSGNENGELTMARVTPAGAVTVIDPGQSGFYTSFAISPDGRRLALGIGAGTGALNIWTQQLDRGPLQRFTFGGADRRPAWSPDGKMIAFIRDTAGTSRVMGRAIDGNHADTLLVHSSRQMQSVEWSRDGKWLVVRTDNGEPGAGDILGFRTDGDSTPVPLAATPYSELSPALSPDGKWLAYTSNESGRAEVYLRPFPNTNAGRRQISTGGGGSPRWAPDSRTLYFEAPPGVLMKVRITTAPAFEAGTPERLFDASAFWGDDFHHSFEVTPDGRAFIFAVSPRPTGLIRSPLLVRIDHWFSDLSAQLEQ